MGFLSVYHALYPSLHSTTAPVTQVHEDGPTLRIYIGDIKSSNGMFTGGEGSSGEGLESKPFESHVKVQQLHRESYPPAFKLNQNFSTIVVSKDSKAVIYRKAVSRILCVPGKWTAQAAVCAR